MSATQVTVRLLDKEYQISCPEEERTALLEAADFLNRRMREIRDSGRVVGLDRIAVMAALNLAHDFLAIEAEGSGLADNVSQRLSLLNGKLDQALDKKPGKGGDGQLQF